MSPHSGAFPFASLAAPARRLTAFLPRSSDRGRSPCPLGSSTPLKVNAPDCVDGSTDRSDLLSSLLRTIADMSMETASAETKGYPRPR
ncbi:MAG: hypothetical protein Q7S52_04605 [bacterium]|nr:hypothetical protein [bacterium]